MLRRLPLRRAVHRLTGALCLFLLACSGGGNPTGPGGDDPMDPVEPGPPHPFPNDPGPNDPGPTQPGRIIAGSYQLTLINGESTPGQMVSVANPDGILIGLYRFQATTTLILDPLGAYSLSIEYSDDKASYRLDDAGAYKWSGATNGVTLVLTSETWGDVFEGAAAQNGAAAIWYDFDGDGRTDTQFEFQKVAGD